MEQVNFSVVVTVFNEEENISILLDSLINQSSPPIEIIIVDAGSTDRTISIVEAFERRYPSVKILVRKGVNRSQGRNIGINEAKSKYIAVTDSGCETDPHWLEYLGQGFTGSTEAVAGFYIPVVKKPLHKLFSWYVVTTPERFNKEEYLPSSRSLAFTKAGWEKAGKYPENLNTCEDLVFAQKLHALKVMQVQKQALVYWQQADTFERFFRQIKGYARGDVEARYIPHLKKIATIWLRYAVFLIFPPLFFLYLMYPLIKFRKLIGQGYEWLWLPLVQVTADMGVLTGSMEGLVFKAL